MYTSSLKGGPVDSIVAFVLTSTESKNFGANWATFWALGANFFTVLQAWSTLKQREKIRAAEKADGVSLYFFAYLTGYCFSFIYYGWHQHSITIILNGLLGFIFLQVVVSIVRYRGITKREVAMVLGIPLMVLMMVFVPKKEAVLFVYLFGIFVFLLDVPLRIRREKKVGQVEVRVLYVFVAVGIFWSLYAFTIGDVPLMIFNPLAVVVYLWTIRLYRKYRKPLTAEEWRVSE